MCIYLIEGGGVSRPSALLSNGTEGAIMNRLHTNISPDYVKNWDISQAIRELIQNYLDSLSEFDCNGTLTWESGMGVAKDLGPGLEPRHFAMGVSEKSSKAKGKYGEGLKLALLTFAREGRFVEIRSKNRIIRPVIAKDPNYGTDLLALDVISVETGQGTEIRFACSWDELAQGKSYFVEFSDEFDEFEWMEQDLISSPGGDIYVNGTKVGTLENALFSYHLDEEVVGDIGNRDREVIDMAKATNAISQIVADTTSVEVKEQILKHTQNSSVWEVNNVRINPWSLNEKQKRAWTKVAHDVFGKNAVIPSYSHNVNSQAQYAGYRPLSRLPYRWTNLLEGIKAFKTAEDALQESVKTDNRVFLKDLRKDERENYHYALNLIKKYYSTEKFPITILEDMSSVGESDASVVGMWNPKTGRIFIHRKVLSDRRDALHTMLHEYVHAISGYNDCTGSFQDALLEVGVNMMMNA